ncbi:hypothetical protein JD78_01184 [Modestobacter roseus]|uniref:Uncharacterized protein n=1 Tax=Modestobacter roseus TaxID=1181884 RepID=A0A562IPZ2_9ACTN|nr:hypothetical protein JD78_01184 [Modestobacter roseus]
MWLAIPAGQPVSGSYAIIFLLLFVLIAITLAVIYFRNRKR